MRTIEVLIIVIAAITLLFVSAHTCAAIGRATNEKKSFSLLGFLPIIGIIMAEIIVKRKQANKTADKEEGFLE